MSLKISFRNYEFDFFFSEALRISTFLSSNPNKFENV